MFFVIAFGHVKQTAFAIMYKKTFESGAVCKREEGGKGKGRRNGRVIVAVVICYYTEGEGF